MTHPSPTLDDEVPATQCSTRTRSRLNARSRARCSSPAATAPPPALLEVVEPPPRQAPILGAEASGQHFQDLAPAELPKLYLPLLVSTDRKVKGDNRIKQRLRSAKEPEERTPLFCLMSESPSRKREGFQDNATRKREVCC